MNKKRFIKSYRDSVILEIIESLELDFIEFVESDIEKRKKLLPLTDKEQIKGLIWYLLKSEKYKKMISYEDYSKIIDIFILRLKK